MTVSIRYLFADICSGSVGMFQVFKFLDAIFLILNVQMPRDTLINKVKIKYVNFKSLFNSVNF